MNWFKKIEDDERRVSTGSDYLDLLSALGRWEKPDGELNAWIRAHENPARQQPVEQRIQYVLESIPSAFPESHEEQAAWLEGIARIDLAKRGLRHFGKTPPLWVTECEPLLDEHCNRLVEAVKGIPSKQLSPHRRTARQKIRQAVNTVPPHGNAAAARRVSLSGGPFIPWVLIGKATVE